MVSNRQDVAGEDRRPNDPGPVDECSIEAAQIVHRCVPARPTHSRVEPGGQDLIQFQVVTWRPTDVDDPADGRRGHNHCAEIIRGGDPQHGTGMSI